jgi:anti-sigma factor RsiW
MNDTHGPGGDMEQDDLDLYVDGLLDDERRAAFERKLFADPELAAALERQRSLKARLTAAFPVPEDPVAIAQRALAAARALPGGRPRRVGVRRLALLRVAVAAS